MKRSSRFWAAVIATLLALSLAGCLLVWLLSRGGTVANIYLDGELVRSIDLARLDEGFSFSVEGPAGANTIQAEPAASGCPMPTAQTRCASTRGGFPPPPSPSCACPIGWSLKSQHTPLKRTWTL